MEGIAPIVLAVDDNSDDVDLLRLLPRKPGMANPLEVYREGEAVIAALTQLVQRSVDAMRPSRCFLDVKMPAMSGHDVLRWIRAQPALDRLPVVMRSSSEHPDDIKRANEGGAQCYLAKYPQPAVLKKVLEDAERFAMGAPAGE